MGRFALWGLPALLLAAFLTACSLLAPAQIANGVQAPGESPVAVRARQWDGPEWWRAFGDPVLDRFIDAVQGSNFDLDQAVARLDQARAMARMAKAPTLPSVHASAGGSKVDAPTNAGIGAQLTELGLGSDIFGSFGFVLPSRLDLETYSAAAEFAYEVDFWGRNRDAARAAGAERLAAEADLRTVRIKVVAQTAATYFEVVDLRRQRALAGEMVRNFKAWERLAAARYERGLDGARSLHALRRSVREAEAELPLIEAALADAQGRLWVLVGAYREDLAAALPDALAFAASQESLPESVRADLVRQRPDVRAAHQRLEAARYALGARRAALLPTLSVSGAIGLASAEPADWFDPDQWFQNLGANLLGPVFQGGRLRGNVALAEARHDEAVAAFGRAVVTATHEVQSALAGLAGNARRLVALAAIEEAAQAEAALQRQRYLSGVEGHAGLLAATQVLIQAQSAHSAALRDVGHARLALHRAIGGAWHPGAAADQRWNVAGGVQVAAADME